MMSGRAREAPDDQIMHDWTVILQCLARVLIKDDPNDAELKKLLSAPIKDETVVLETIKALRGHRALEQSREVIQKYAADTRKYLSDLPSGKAKDALVSLSEAVVSRTAWPCKVNSDCN